MHALPRVAALSVMRQEVFMRNLSIVLIFISYLPLVSLADQQSVVPLKVGNEWNYVVNNSEDNIRKSEILKKETIDGVDWYLSQEFGDLFWVSNQEAGQFEAINSFGEMKLQSDPLEQELILKFHDGKKFSYSTSGGDIQVEPCEEKLVVPAGEFECVKYTFDLGGGDYSVSYYSVGVGLIKNEFKTNESVEVSELSSFKL